MAIDVTKHPYGPGSHAPLAELGEMPACYPIKGSVTSMSYQRPDSQDYRATIAEVWFDSPSAAEAAGFALAARHSADVGSADYEPGGSHHPCDIAAVNANRRAVIGAAATATSGFTTVDGDSSGDGSGSGPVAGVMVVDAAGVAERGLLRGDDDDDDSGAGLGGDRRKWWWLLLLLLGLVLFVWLLTI